MNIQRKQVCVQGLGFVGAAMAVAIANARSSDGAILYQVTGIDQDTPSGLERIEALENGVFPFSTPDTNLHEALGRAHEAGNLSATTDEFKYAEADIVVIDVPLDISFKVEQPLFEMESLEDAVKGIAWHIRSGALILVETTVSPGITRSNE